MHVVIVGNLSVGHHAVGPFDSYAAALRFCGQYVRKKSLCCVFELVPKEVHMPIYRPVPNEIEIPEWAIEQATGEHMTDERLAAFVIDHETVYDKYVETHRSAIMELADTITRQHMEGPDDA